MFTLGAESIEGEESESHSVRQGAGGKHLSYHHLNRQTANSTRDRSGVRQQFNLIHNINPLPPKNNPREESRP